MIQVQYVVGKPLPSATGILPSGTVIDPTGWKNLDKLINQGYVSMISETEAVLVDRNSETRERTAPSKGKGKRNGK